MPLYELVFIETGPFSNILEQMVIFPIFFFFQVKYKRFFEPYVFVDKTLLPKYDVRFIGRFLNKSTLFCTMNKQG